MTTNNEWHEYRKGGKPSKYDFYVVLLEGWQWGMPPVDIARFNVDEGVWDQQRINVGVSNLGDYVTHWCEIPPVPKKQSTTK